MRSNFVAGLLGGLVSSAMLLAVSSFFLVGPLQPGAALVHAAGVDQPIGSPRGALTAVTPTPRADGGVLGPGDAPADGSVQIAPLSTTAPAATLAGRAFTYQGMLRLTGAPVNGVCEFQFGAWDAPAAGAQLGVTQTLTSTVTNGLFTVLLNGSGQFGGTAFDGRAAWLATNVRCPSGSGAFTPLDPRQAVTAAPLASGLVPHASLNAGDSYSGFPVLRIDAPATEWSNPMALQVSSGPHSNFVGTFTRTGIWGDSGSGKGVWGTTNSGMAIIGSAGAGGWAGYFEGDVTMTGKVVMPRFKVTQAIRRQGVGLPITSTTFATSGGTLVLQFSGSGYSGLPGKTIGMMVMVDGNYVDHTSVYANQGATHLAFVPGQTVLTSIAAGSHTVSLRALFDTSTDHNDIFFVNVMELPY